MKPYLKSLISFGLPFLILLIPTEWIPLEGLTLIEKRVIALFFLAALSWILEPIPIYATSLLVIVLELVLISDKGLVWLIKSDSPETMGNLIPYKSIFSTFASPIILLFMGGFFLAMAATKYRLDQNLARVLLKPFGKSPTKVMFGLMMITALFSMFMSNTATTAMMLSILAPVLAVFQPNDKGKTAFALCIPLAANLGGIGTPIGTPPNAIALKYLTGDNLITFGEWMAFGLPYVACMLVIGWFTLKVLFPISTPAIELKIKGKFLKTNKAYTVYATFILTILLWLTDFIHGMNSYVVAMLPVAIFSATGIVNKDDLRNISWDVLWLVSGGIALGLALEKSGLAANLVNAIPFASFPGVVIIGSAMLIGIVMANFMSNTATANLLLPIIAALAVSLPALNELGGTKILILSVTISVSLGMSLPISTPPNALAHGTGLIQTSQMTKIGVIMGIIGLLLDALLMWGLKTLGF